MYAGLHIFPQCKTQTLAKMANKLVKVKFLRSVSCDPYYLAYNAGQYGYVTPGMAVTLENDKMAVYVDEPKKETSVADKDGTAKPKRTRRSTRKHK